MNESGACSKTVTKYKIQDLRSVLLEFDLLGIIDLSEIASSHDVVYRFFRDRYKSTYEHKERMVLYSKYKPDFDLLSHIQKALSVYDISNSFVLLICPGNIKEDLDIVRQKYSTDEWSIQHLDIEIVDAGELLSNFKLSSTMCPLPWTQLKIHANGDMSPCCLYKDQLKDDRSQVININTHTIAEFYQSSALESIRQELSVGIQHKGCRSCWHAEEMNFNSARKFAFSAQGKEFYPMDLKNTTMENFISLDLEMGNLCNLKCNICNWTRSSQIATEVMKKNSLLVPVIKKFNQQSKWINDTVILKKLTEIDSNIKFLEFEGGEPLLHVYHHDLLKHFVDSGKSNHIRLRYSTNGTIFPSLDMLELWGKFKEVHLCLSIDDIGKRFEYQRTNADWKTVEQNLKRFRDCNISSLRPSVFTSVSLQNVFYLPELLEYFQQYNWNVIFNLVSDPKELALSSITEQTKQMVLEKLNQYVIDFPCLELVIMSIERSETSDGEGFRNFITDLDIQRNRDFNESHPEIAKAMDYVDDEKAIYGI